MTDDQTQPIETPKTDPAPAAMDAPEPSMLPVEPNRPPVRRPNRLRWAVAILVAIVAIGAAAGALALFGKASSPEALRYIPGDEAFVFELRLDLPGDQMQTVGNLLAHFPGFKDQSTLTEKIDQALSQLVARVPGSSVNYLTDVKPIIGGPLFIGIESFKDVATERDPTNFTLVATTNGAASCGTTFRGQTLTTETYNGVELSTSADGKAACAVDGRFFIVGDPAGVKLGLDAHRTGTGLDKSVRYQAARAALGLDRLATLYIDGGSLATALPSMDPALRLGDIAGALPEWVMAGLRAEDDAIVADVVVAPAPNASFGPSMRTFPPAHPLEVTAFAPADALVFYEQQAASVSIHNLLTPLMANPQVAEAFKSLDQFGGLDGLIDWVDDVGFVVVRDGDTPAGGIVLVATDAAAASEKLTTLTTVLGLGALGSDIEITKTTVEGVKVTTVHIPDISALAGTAGGTAIPAIPLDLSIAAKDRYVLLGIGDGIMSKLLGVKAGAGLADDPAFKRALTVGLANPQLVLYVAAGASIDWIESASGSLGGPAWPAEVKAYLDPMEGFIYTVVGDGLHGSFRMALTVVTTQ